MRNSTEMTCQNRQTHRDKKCVRGCRAVLGGKLGVTPKGTGFLEG